MAPCWMSSLVTPGKTAPPSRALGGSPADTTAGVATGRWGQSAEAPLFPPWLSYHCVLLLTPAPCSFIGTQITCRSVPLSLFRANSTFFSLHDVVAVCSRRMPRHRYAGGGVTSAFPLPVFSSFPATCAPSPSSQAACPPRPLISPP